MNWQEMLPSAVAVLAATTSFASLVLLGCALSTGRERLRRRFSLVSLVGGAISLGTLLLVTIFERDESGAICAVFGFIIIVLPSLLVFRHACKHVPKGICAQCGYNLTGNVSGVCPECGMVTREREQAEEKARVEEATKSLSEGDVTDDEDL